MSDVYFCRVGRHSQIGKFRNPSSAMPRRGQSVVVRTARGIEIAEVLSQVSNDSNRLRSDAGDGTILRRVTPEDQLLQQQLTQAAATAFENCQQFLRRMDSRDCLLDVEPLLDGKTLYFHFVGAPDEGLSAHLQSLAEVFRETIQASRFAQLLEEGCGPGCGSEEKGGCGESGSCAVCVIASACKK